MLEGRWCVSLAPASNFMERSAHTSSLMKSAYELAMERLAKSDPVTPLTPAQKQEIAEVENRYQAKIAEKRVFLEGEIRKASGTGEEEALRRQLASEVSRLQEEMEAKKNSIRAGT